ncbi:MAG: hypothetical protein KBE30_08855 [Desulfobacter sp.]|nr:hypothetical protein [Desulfobacter sp.]
MRSQDIGDLQRKENCRDERISPDDPHKIVFSFKYYLPTKLKQNDQSFVSWQKDKILAKFLETLKSISELTMTEAKQANLITEYGDFPVHSKFSCPPILKGHKRWAVVKKISGQEARVAGIISDNIFYVVYLDKNHDFWPTEKKNT